MTSHLRTELQNARPSLKLVSPLVYRICQGFSIINILIGLLLIFGTTNVKRTPLAISQGVIGFTAWGIIYIVLGLAIAYALLRNNWGMIRKALVVGLATKFMWTISLVLLLLQGYPVVATTLLWLFLAWVQIWTIVHFIPAAPWEENNKR